MTEPQRAASSPRVSSGLKLEPDRPRSGALLSGSELARPLDDATRVRLQKAFVLLSAARP